MLTSRLSPVFYDDEVMPQELTTSHEAEILEECQKSIGYQFRQPELLRGPERGLGNDRSR